MKRNFNSQEQGYHKRPQQDKRPRHNGNTDYGAIGSLKLPGIQVDHRTKIQLSRAVQQTLGIEHRGFPGSQPVSFQKKNFADLLTENYFVCEKSDGTRALMYITVIDNRAQTFMIDRHNNFWNIPNIAFPLPASDQITSKYHINTIVDGEYIEDIEDNGSKTYRYLAYDLLAINGASVMSKTLDKRLGQLGLRLLKPYQEFLKNNKELAKLQVFRFEMKKMELSYGLVKVLEEIPKLKHKNDGLIFTSAVAPYIPGTCEKILKWKPADENSVDFKLIVKSNPNSPIPTLELHAWKGRDEYEFFSYLNVTDSEWERFSRIGNLDGAIIEACVDGKFLPDLVWKFMRIRDDKPHGNHISVVEKILISIKDGVSAQELKDKTPLIRAEWKKR